MRLGIGGISGAVGGISTGEMISGSSMGGWDGTGCGSGGMLGSTTGGTSGPTGG